MKYALITEEQIKYLQGLVDEAICVNNSATTLYRLKTAKLFIGSLKVSEPEQKPVGSVVEWLDGTLVHGWFGDPPPVGTLLYTAPPSTSGYAKKIESLIKERDELRKALAQPEQWTPVEIGVDVTPEGTHVVGMYVLMPDVVRHVFYSQFHPAPVSKPDTRLKVKLGRQYGFDLNGHWFYLQPADEYAKTALSKHSGISATPSKPEQEPVAWMHTFGSDIQINTLPAHCYGNNWTRTPLYATPPKQWVGLTDEEIDTAWRIVDYTESYEEFRISVARAIEQSLRIKNEQI